MVPSQSHAVDSRTRSRIDSVDREKADRRVLLLLPAPLDRLVDVEHLGAEEYFLPNLKQFVEEAVERCGKGEPQAEFEEGNDTVQSCDERAPRPPKERQGAAATFVVCSESGSEMLSCKSCRELPAKPEARSVPDDALVRNN